MLIETPGLTPEVEGIRRFKKYSAEEQYEIDFQHRLANRNCYLDKYGDANINHYYKNLEIKHSQPKNRASGKRVS